MSLKKSLLVFFLVAGVLVPLMWFLSWLPYGRVNNFLDRAPALATRTVNTRFPRDLVIRLEGGMLSLNRPLPYCLVLDPNTQSGLLFVEEVDPMYLEAQRMFADCFPVAVAGESLMMYEDSTAGYRLQSYPTIDLQVDRTVVEQLMADVMPVLSNYGRVVYHMAPVMLLMVLVPFLLVLNLWYALVLRLIFAIFFPKRSVTFAKSYAAALQAQTIWIIVSWGFFSLVQQYAGLSIPSMPFLGTIVVTIIGLLLFFTEDHDYGEEEGHVDQDEMDRLYSTEPTPSSDGRRAGPGEHAPVQSSTETLPDPVGQSPADLVKHSMKYDASQVDTNAGGQQSPDGGSENGYAPTDFSGWQDQDGQQQGAAPSAPTPADPEKSSQ